MTSEDHSVDNLRSQTEETYSELAAKYASYWVDKPDMELVQKFTSLVPDGARILDAGCGPAHYSLLFSNMGYDVYAIDYSVGMLGQARQVWETGPLARMDMKDIALASQQFDAIWASASVPHIPEEILPHVLGGFRRILKPEHGYLFINASLGSSKYWIETPDELGRTDGRSGRYFKLWRRPEEFTEYLTSAGFDVVDTHSRNVYSEVVENAENKGQKFWVNFFCKLRA